MSDRLSKAAIGMSVLESKTSTHDEIEAATEPYHVYTDTAKWYAKRSQVDCHAEYPLLKLPF